MEGNQEQPPGNGTCAVAGTLLLQFGLKLCCSYLEILSKF